MERLTECAIAGGHQIAEVVKEVGSGVDDNRRQRSKLLGFKSYNRLMVEHKDLLIRFGFKHPEILFDEQPRTIEVANESEKDNCE